MKSFKDLMDAIANKKILIWNDPDPIKGNNYRINYIEDVSLFDEDDDRDSSILIQYNNGSEAQVYLHEIIIL